MVGEVQLRHPVKSGAGEDLVICPMRSKHRTLPSSLERLQIGRSRGRAFRHVVNDHEIAARGEHPRECGDASLPGLHCARAIRWRRSDRTGPREDDRSSAPELSLSTTARRARLPHSRSPPASGSGSDRRMWRAAHAPAPASSRRGRNRHRGRAARRTRQLLHSTSCRRVYVARPLARGSASARWTVSVELPPP